VSFTIEAQALNGVVLLRPDVYEDHRGFFMEAYRADQFRKLGLPERFVQDNHSGSSRGVVRGLHFQWDPPMGKLMRATAGAAFAVAVDIDIVEEDPLLGHLIAATDVDLITHGVHNDRDAVQLTFVLVEGTHSGSGRGGEVAVESRFQIRRYLLGAAALDSVARNEIDQL